MKSKNLASEPALTWEAPLQKMALVDKGLTKRQLALFKEKAGLDYDQLAYLLGVTRVTLIRKTAKEKLSPAVSEKLMALEDLYQFGYSVFPNVAAFNHWLAQPNWALGGKIPLDIMHRFIGLEAVRNLIGRVLHGVYS